MVELGRLFALFIGLAAILFCIAMVLMLFGFLFAVIYSLFGLVGVIIAGFVLLCILRAAMATV